MSQPPKPAGRPNPFRITDAMLVAAVRIDDVDDALYSVMRQVNITTGDVAGVLFAGDYARDWPTADVHYRLQMLREWRDLEQQCHSAGG